MGQVNSTTYDSSGRTLTTTDADGQVTLYVYGDSSLTPAAFASNPGSANQLYAKYYFDNATDYSAFIADPTGSTQPNETIVYSYYTAADVQNGVVGAFAGEVKSITDNLATPANGDPRSPYTNTTTFQYDANGNMTQESGPSGIINYVYDLATQRHTETWTGTSYADAVTDIQYGYNDLGELASVTVLKENGQTPATVASSDKYDASGGTSTTNLPNTVYTYDLGGRLKSSIDSATGITTSYTYKPNTNDISTETVTRNLSPVTLAVYSYAYRADGLKTGETDTTYNSDGTVNDTRTLSWQYDGLDRVTQETSSDTAGTAALNYTDLYQYDLNSNRTAETIENGSGTVTDTITSSYNANDELTQAVDANTGTTVYTYDNNGSQIETQHTPSGGTSPDTTTTNEYDLQGQMAGTQTTNSSGTTKATYEYDDSGNRIVETNTNTAGTTTTMYYLVDTQNPNGYPQPIEQAATPGSPQITYVWGKTLISQTYATGATIPGVGTATSPMTYYILTDAHGSTRLVVNATGQIAESMNYDAFGNALGFNANSALTTYLYSSMPFDPASGNYYDHARFYNAGIGEFTQSDYGNYGTLSDPMSYLPYAFTGGDPVNMLDLNGHDFSIADTLSVESISDFLDTGLGYVNTVFKVYNSAQDILRVIQYAQFAVQVVQALAGAPTLAAAEEGVGAAITQAFPDFEVNSLSAGFSAAYNVLAKDWEQISKAIAAKIPEIAAESALYASENLPGWTTAYEEGRLKFMVFAPSGPGPLGKIVPINIGKELQLALSAGGGRLFGFGIRTSNQSYNQIFRIDYWENGSLWVHYHTGFNINGGGISIWGTPT